MRSSWLVRSALWPAWETSGRKNKSSPHHPSILELYLFERFETKIKGSNEKVHTFRTVSAYHVHPWACLRCLKGSVGSCWPGINVVKSWLYGVDLLLIGS